MDAWVGFFLDKLTSRAAPSSPFPCCRKPPLGKQPGGYISTLSSGHPASASSPVLALSGDVWEPTVPHRKATWGWAFGVVVKTVVKSLACHTELWDGQYLALFLIPAAC